MPFIACRCLLISSLAYAAQAIISKKHDNGEKNRTFFLASPGGADSSLRMLSLRALMRSGGVLCFVLKKFIVLLSWLSLVVWIVGMGVASR